MKTQINMTTMFQLTQTCNYLFRCLVLLLGVCTWTPCDTQPVFNLRYLSIPPYIPNQFTQSPILHSICNPQTYPKHRKKSPCHWFKKLFTSRITATNNNHPHPSLVCLGKNTSIGWSENRLPNPAQIQWINVGKTMSSCLPSPDMGGKNGIVLLTSSSFISIHLPYIYICKYI